MFNGEKLSGTDILVRAKDSKVNGNGREGWVPAWRQSLYYFQALRLRPKWGWTVSDRCSKLVSPTLRLAN